MRDTSRPLDFESIKGKLLEDADVHWVVQDAGQGFSFRGSDEFFLTYSSAEGAAIHHEGNERVIELCERVASDLKAFVVMM